MQRVKKAQELVAWVNGVLGMTIESLDEMKNGVALIQLVHSLAPESFDLARCDFWASTPYHYEKNFKLLQEVLDINEINKDFIIERVVEGEKQRDLMMFVAYMQHHYDTFKEKRKRWLLQGGLTAESMKLQQQTEEEVKVAEAAVDAVVHYNPVAERQAAVERRRGRIKTCRPPMSGGAVDLRSEASGSRASGALTTGGYSGGRIAKHKFRDPSKAFPLIETWVRSVDHQAAAAPTASGAQQRPFRKSGSPELPKVMSAEDFSFPRAGSHSKFDSRGGTPPMTPNLGPPLVWVVERIEGLAEVDFWAHDDDEWGACFKEFDPNCVPWGENLPGTTEPAAASVSSGTAEEKQATERALDHQQRRIQATSLGAVGGRRAFTSYDELLRRKQEKLKQSASSVTSSDQHQGGRSVSGDKWDDFDAFLNTES